MGHDLGGVHDLPGRRLRAFHGELGAERVLVADQQRRHPSLALRRQGASNSLRRRVVAAHRVKRDTGSHKMQGATSA